MSRALVAMSGGVDSSVAAYLAKKSGLDCIGVNMRLFDNEDAGISRERSCCSLDDAEDARSVANKLDIPFHVFNFTGDFKANVIDRFISAYENGETPNPCIDCNRYIKFDSLYRRAKLLGCDYIITGHYARVVNENGKFYLRKAADAAKDQTYMLYSLTQEQLSHTLFPLGDISDKEETRRIAEENGFLNARKKDSQDICFVPDGNYSEIIRMHTGREYPEGNFVDKNGNILGRHSGIINYTVGQRRGLGTAFGKPMYVCEKRPAANEVVLGEEKDLFSCDFFAGDVSWTDCPPADKFRASVMIRYRRAEQPAEIEILGDRIHVRFDSPQRAVSPGQAAVIYSGDTVLGGGVILS